ncbi:glutaminase A [Whalleya microplaca]|nr:glutaminase A [Whalleya microplaca]
MRLRSILAGVAVLSDLALGDIKFGPTRPPAIPLAVRAPYLNSWLDVGSDGGNGGYLAGEWAQFWTQQVTGWQGFIRVDGKAYNWMGASSVQADLVDEIEFSYTSTRSTFVSRVDDKVEMNITFLSPVTPSDLKRQSLVFSYLEVAVQSLDGASHEVQLYTDVSAEWACGNRGDVVNWDYQSADGVAYHQFWRADQVEITESSEQPNWGNWFWSTKDVDNLSWQSGADSDVRGNFVSSGVLPNTKDTDFRAVNDNWPVFGLANNLGSVGAASVSTLYSIGITQDNAINLLGKESNLTTYPSLWKSYFGSDVEAMTWFYNDYEDASNLATNLDNQVASDSVAAGGSDYLSITSLSVRQTFGALQFTGTDADPLVFLKEISSNSDIQTVDVIYPAIPLLLYTNPSLVEYLLKPLFLNQENGHYPNTNAIHDLGTFPVAKGYTDGSDEPMPLEECGNMIIMALAYAQRANDADYLTAHYPILKQWAGYLVDEALIPANQISTDDFAGSLANQTNLALKGIIGLRAMSEIAKMTGNTVDADTFGDNATSYIAQWQTLGINSAANPKHATLSYDDPDSHGLLYNLYANSLLGFNADFVPQDIYDIQSDFYPNVTLTYGVPLDTRHNYTKTDWMLWAAATTHTDTRNDIIHRIAMWIGATTTNRALTDLYDAVAGDYPPGLSFTARPVVGGHFALLALKELQS